MISIWLLIKQRKRGTKIDNEQQLQQKNGEGKSEQRSKQHTQHINIGTTNIPWQLCQHMKRYE